MMAARNFPFGNEPARATAEQTAPLPPSDPQMPDPQKTEQIPIFTPPLSVLPFSGPLLPPPQPHEPPVLAIVALADLTDGLPLPRQPLVPPPPLRAPARAPLSLGDVAALVLIVLDVAVLLYLALTWRR